MTVDDRRAREASLSSLLGWAVATGRETHQLARRRRMRSLWLTAGERDTCLDELAEQYAVGRLDKAELDRRMDLLDQAVTHGDLGPVFAGLPWPTFRTASTSLVRANAGIQPSITAASKSMTEDEATMA